MEVALSNNQQWENYCKEGTNMGSANTIGALAGRLGTVSNQMTQSTLLAEPHQDDHEVNKQ
jgi:hypothetical protein